MRIIFCDSGFSPKEVEYMYREEYDAAKANNFQTSLISFEALKREEITRAIRRVRPAFELETAIYRGWMLKPAQYQTLYDALLTKNIQLINNPVEYKFCHYLPESYDVIKDYTPKTTFKKLEGTFQIANFKKKLAAFGNQSIIVKDYVKSQKHYWEEACFIPNANDLAHTEKVIRRFLELQDEDLNEGLVFREFVELEALTNHSKSGMPLTKEFRLFVKNQKVIAAYKYWDEGDYQGIEPNFERFEALIPKIKSHFFTMDIAQQKNGEWIIVELGDGQVAGLPNNAGKLRFYENLYSAQ